jgi:hypothetical protein
MMDYFIRFITKPEYAESDLERGYSFDVLCYSSREETEEAAEEEGRDPETIAEFNGSWGFVLDGLCVFGSYETVEEAEEDAKERGGYNGSYPFAAIYEGSHCGFCIEGDIFRAQKLVKVVAL